MSHILPGTDIVIESLPKVSLHDHLDGGLRPATIVDLAGDHELELPTNDPAELGEWFAKQSDSGSLVEYLKTFDITTGVMQTAGALRRIAREFVEDLHADGVVCGEIRWAPEQHLRRGLSLDQAVEAVQEGIDEAVSAVRASGGGPSGSSLMAGCGAGSCSVARAAVAVCDRSSAAAMDAAPSDTSGGAAVKSQTRGASAGGSTTCWASTNSWLE